MIETHSPFPPVSFYDLFDWSQAVWQAVASDDSPTERAEFIEAQEKAAQSEGVKTWGVYRDGELGGYVRFERFPAQPWTGAAHCIFKKDFFGRKTTLPALQMIAREIFGSGVQRIGLHCFVDNSSMRALIVKLGGRFEGELTKQVMRGGELVSMAVYGLTSEDLELAAKGHDVDTYERVIPRRIMNRERNSRRYAARV